MRDLFVPQQSFVQALLAIFMVAVVVVASPLPGIATAQTEASVVATPVEEFEELPVDTGGDDGVENADGTDPLSTPIPTPTAVPPTPPLAPPTQVPTDVPPTPTQMPTATPTPTPPASGDVSVQRIVSGTGCTQVSSTDIVPVGTAVEFRCDGANFSLLGPVTRTLSGVTPGWQYQINNGTWRDSGGTEVTTHTFGLSEFTVRLRPTTTVVPGNHGTITITIETPSIFGGSYTTTIGATRQVSVPTAADLQLVCDPVSISANVNAAQIVTCTYSGRASLNTRQITLARITVPAPAGWSITSPVGSVTGRTLTISPNAVISSIATSPRSYTFSYTLTPGCTAPTTAQPINLTSTFSFSATTGIVGASFSQAALRTNTNNLAVSVRSSSLVWDEMYSLTDTTVSGSLMYRMEATGCSGWNVTVSASSFNYTGPNTGTAIPASSLRLTETGNPIVISGGGTGVTRQVATGPMNTPISVLSATAGSGNGTYDQQLDFNLVIPGRSVAGTYQSTITVSSAAAP